MLAKIISIAAVVAAVSAQYPSHDHSLPQGHAYSSQSIVHHQVQHPQQKKQQQYQQQPAHQVEYHHQAPVLQAAVLHQAPAQIHYAPASSHSAPAPSHSAPAPTHYAPAQHEELHEEYYAPAKYEFSYHVEDKHTGDIKSQQESRDGDVVKGEYSLHQPDGRIRTVKYTADKHSGFNANVQYSGHAIEPQPQYHHRA